MITAEVFIFLIIMSKAMTSQKTCLKYMNHNDRTAQAHSQKNSRKKKRKTYFTGQHAHRVSNNIFSVQGPVEVLLKRNYFKLIKFILRCTSEESDLTGLRHREESKQQPGVRSPECTGTGSRKTTRRLMYCHTDKVSQTPRDSFRSY